MSDTLRPPVTSVADEAVCVRGLDHAVGGYLHGLAQTFLQASLAFSLPADLDWGPIDAAFRAAVRHAADARPVLSAEPLAGAVERIVHWSAVYQRTAADCVFEPGRILWRTGDGAALTVVALPTIDPNIAAAALKVVVGLINRGVGGAGAADLITAVRGEVDELSEAGRRNPVRPPMGLLLKAAHERRIPWLRLGGTRAFQIGHGARGRWLELSLTDGTPMLGAQIAKNKAATASVLRQIGLPMPAHVVVQSEDAATAAAAQLGYPVVVKPLDADLGLGVAVGLKTPEAVRRAFVAARQYAQDVLVEAFVEGRDYRLIVFQARLIWAVERVPGGVTGDGVSTVRQLVDRLNADPDRGDSVTARMKQLVFDGEAVERLAEVGLDGDSVPGRGVRVRLRGAANMARGGVAVPVFDKVHPDNRQLAERAARALQIEVAGVDLLIPDIGRSWKETGAGICEVNARPDFFNTVAPHLYGTLIEGLVEGDGRIPISLIIGAGAGSTACALCAGILAAAGLRVGVAGPDGVWIGSESVLPASADAFTGGRLLIADRAVDAAIVAVNDTAPSTAGLPFDRCDVVALAGSRLADAPDGGGRFRALARSILPMSTGGVVVNAQDAACAALAPHAEPGPVILYGAEAGLAPLQEHRAKGGRAVWVETGADDRCLVIAAAGADEPIRIRLGESGRGDAGLACAAADVALAAAVAGALGCGEDHLRRGLASVRLRV